MLNTPPDITSLVAKFGGSMALNKDVEAGFLRDCASLHQSGVRVAIVHGGGKRVSEVMTSLGLKPEFAGGHRVTTAETLAVVEWVLSGEANKNLVAELCRFGVRAVGISGRDACLFQGEPMGPQGDFTGRITKVAPELIHDLWDKGYLPVVSPVSTGPGGAALNVNADIAAGELAYALQANALIYVTDVPGVFRDLKSPDSLFPRLTPAEVREMLDGGVFEAGMIPKLQGALRGLGEGRTTVRIVGGPEPGLLKRALQEPALGTTLHA